MTAFLLIVAALTIWVASLYFAPFGPCPGCHGRGHIIRGTGRKPRPATCSRCKGVGRRQRPGSKTVHRVARRIRRELARQRAQRATATTTEE